jgi:hypothetical protein
MRNYTGDEGRSFEFDNQVLISSHRKLLWSKSQGGERCGKGGTGSRQAWFERGERKRTTVEVSKAA